jgi:hypothetical protein
MRAQLTQNQDLPAVRHPDGRTVVVPVHAGRGIAKGTLRMVAMFMAR